MIKSLAGFISQSLGLKADTVISPEHTIELCTAVLMIEIALADSGIDAGEQGEIKAAISEHFHLDEQETQAVVGLARQQQRDANSLHDFTRAINAELSREEKNTLIALLWKVAAADSVVHKYEEYFIRKIADLLYVSHKDYIRAKHRATEVRSEGRGN